MDQLELEFLTITDKKPPPLPLTLRLQGDKLNYRSAIALFLAGKQSHFAPQIAAEIIQGLHRQISPHFAQIHCSPPAWIDFTLTAHTVQNWLEEGLQVIDSHSLTPPETIHSFAQYVRDRCWQLLQLGIEENLIAFLR
ncbi:MAG: hypothetical protein RI580_18790, partial [Halothece sp. Uz-M2-17]|nr:hypothetical protein [Halothece sp. Uz-M2-17]